VVLPVFHYDLPEYCDDSYWEPFWSVCEELGFPVHIHGGVGLPDFGRHTAAMMGLELDYFMTRPFWHLVFSGVFDRHPNLQLVWTETTATFAVPAFLERMDAHAAGGGYGTVYKFSGACELKPSEYWYRNCHIGASIVARTQLAARAQLGVNVLMFGSDYPHEEGTWGRTLEWLQASFGSVGVPEEETRAILGENATKLYGLDPQRLAPLAEQFGPTIGDVLTPAGDDALKALSDEFRAEGRPITGSNMYRPVAGAQAS
jgi:predicted TIM-barrel fold metal-dependent hydrolase